MQNKPLIPAVLMLFSAALGYTYYNDHVPTWYSQIAAVLSLILFLLNAAVRISVGDYWLWTVQHLLFAAAVAGTIVDNGVALSPFVNTCFTLAAALSFYASITQSRRFEKASRDVVKVGRYE